MLKNIVKTSIFKNYLLSEKFLNLTLLIVSIMAFVATTNSFAGVSAKKILLKKGQWTALSSLVNDKKICYGINYSYNSVGNAAFDKSQKAYIDVDFLGRGVFRFSIHFLKTLQTNSTVFVNIDEKQFELKAYQNFAYFANNQEELDFISFLDSGQKIISRSIYNDESYSVESFDVSRFLQIKQALLLSCK